MRHIGHEVYVLLVHLFPLGRQGKPVFLGPVTDEKADAGHQQADAQQPVKGNGPGTGPRGRFDADGQGDLMAAPFSVLFPYAGAECILAGGQIGIDRSRGGGTRVPGLFVAVQLPGVVQQGAGGKVDSSEPQREGVFPVI